MKVKFRRKDDGDFGAELTEDNTVFMVTGYDSNLGGAGYELTTREEVTRLRDFLNKVLDKMPGPDTIST